MMIADKDACVKQLEAEMAKRAEEN